MHSPGGAGSACPNADELGDQARARQGPSGPSGEAEDGAARATDFAAAIVGSGRTGSFRGLWWPPKSEGKRWVGGAQRYSPCLRRGDDRGADTAYGLRRLVWKCRHRGAGPGKADYNSQHAPRHTSWADHTPAPGG